MYSVFWKLSTVVFCWLVGSPEWFFKLIAVWQLSTASETLFYFYSVHLKKPNWSCNGIKSNEMDNTVVLLAGCFPCDGQKLYTCVNLGLHCVAKEWKKKKIDEHCRMENMDRKYLVDGHCLVQRSIEMEKQHLSPSKQVYHIPFACPNKCISNSLRELPNNDKWQHMKFYLSINIK